MMLFKLSLKNIKKSFKDYAIYFFTLILGVAIFYVFNAIDSQTVMLDVTSSTYDIIDLMVNMLSGVSVFVAFILGFLIIYASRFLIKRRNKEFGIYLTLGMSKRKISLILFIETLVIGILSLIVGLGLGICLSQLMSVLVANMFEANMTKFEFVFSNSACLKTFIYFSIMYLIVMIFNTINISKCKLIDLLHANKKSESVKLKNPFVCTIIFIFSSCILGYAYYLVTDGLAQLTSFDEIFIPIALGAISTFLIFWSLSGLILKIVMHFKKVYYKGLNAFTLRQVSSKINTTVFSMTIICLMLFVTICVFSSALSIKNSMIANLDELAPVDVELRKAVVNNQDINNNNKISVSETLETNNFALSNFKEYLEYEIYTIPTLTLQDTFGIYLESIMANYKFLDYHTKEQIISISDYNKIAKMYNLPTYSLNEDEYMIIADFKNMVEVRNLVLKNGAKINLNGVEYKPKYKECQKGFIEISSNHVNRGIILVPNSALENLELTYKGLIANYNAKDKNAKQQIENELATTINNIWQKTSTISINTRLTIAESSIGLGALVTFIGLYLGIVFLISSAAILALKELSESADNKTRFQMLRKLGADEHMLNKALFRQIALFFIFPLLIAIIHSIFGIQFCSTILETFGNEKLLPSIIMTAVFLVFIYGGYFLLTYTCSKNIIKDK